MNICEPNMWNNSSGSSNFSFNSFWGLVEKYFQFSFSKLLPTISVIVQLNITPIDC